MTNSSWLRKVLAMNYEQCHLPICNANDE